jgi:hypothetical protein
VLPNANKEAQVFAKKVKSRKPIDNYSVEELVPRVRHAGKAPVVAVGPLPHRHTRRRGDDVVHRRVAVPPRRRFQGRIQQSRPLVQRDPGRVQLRRRLRGAASSTTVGIPAQSFACEAIECRVNMQ